MPTCLNLHCSNNHFSSSNLFAVGVLEVISWSAALDDDRTDTMFWQAKPTDQKETMWIQRGRSSVKRKQNQTKRPSKGGVPPAGAVGDHRRLLPHRARDRPSSICARRIPPGSPPHPHWARSSRAPPSALVGLGLGPRGDGGPDPAFCLDFAFPCGARLLVWLPRRRRTWIWRRSTRSWPRSMDRSAISSAHCSKLKPFRLLWFGVFVVCLRCPRMVFRSQFACCDFATGAQVWRPNYWPVKGKFIFFFCPLTPAGLLLA